MREQTQISIYLSSTSTLFIQRMQVPNSLCISQLIGPQTYRNPDLTMLCRVATTTPCLTAVFTLRMLILFQFLIILVTVVQVNKIVLFAWKSRCWIKVCFVTDNLSDISEVIDNWFCVHSEVISVHLAAGGVQLEVIRHCHHYKIMPHQSVLFSINLETVKARKTMI